MHDLMLADVHRTRPDALIIDAMTRRETKPHKPVSFSDFRAITARTLAPHLAKSGERVRDTINRLIENGWVENQEYQICHMPPEINHLVYEAIKDALQSGIWDPVVPDTYPHAHPWTHYYVKT
jgi:hypothetical protein